MVGCFLNTCRRFAADTELEVGGKKESSLKEGDREGHGQKTGRGDIEEDEGKKEKEITMIMLMMMMMKKDEEVEEKEEQEKEVVDKAAMNTKSDKNDAIFYAISHSTIAMIKASA
jgi:hypothetical protein